MSDRNQRGGSSQRQYRGIRMRRWGKWVSEIGEPSTRTRIWLGSFRTAEEAAHAYDAALVCIGGPNAQLNFPNDPPTIPRGTPGRYTTREIQAAAAASAAASVGRPFSYSDFMSPKASDSHDGQDLEDITYTEPAQAAQPAPSNRRYTTREIQAAAAASAAASVGRPFSYSDFMSPKASDSHDGQDLEDITYTEPAQAAQPAPSNSTQSYDSCSNAGQFDDPYERECVNNMIYPPHPKDDSDDDNDSFVEPSLQTHGSAGPGPVGRTCTPVRCHKPMCKSGSAGPGP
ncbi:unnamed protein product, partial [Sphagnum balticum]